VNAIVVCDKHINKNTGRHMYARAHIHALDHVDTQTNTKTHTHTRTNTYTQIRTLKHTKISQYKHTRTHRRRSWCCFGGCRASACYSSTFMWLITVILSVSPTYCEVYSESCRDSRGHFRNVAQGLNKFWCF
jgi:hypothetical protein